jgi:hypothetical protein
MIKVKYRHLWAWDNMMGSFLYYKEMNQARAEEENAPINAVYKAHDGSWVTFDEVRSPEAKERILRELDGR